MSFIESCAPPSGVPEMLMLNFRGMFRSALSPRIPSWNRSSNGSVSITSSFALPATGLPEMFRIVSPPADRVVTPTDSSFFQISGMSSSSIQCSCIDCRVVKSIQRSPNSGFDTGPSAYSRATSPIARSWPGSNRPLAFVNRIIKYPSWPDRWWKIPQNLNRENHFSRSSSGIDSHPASANSSIRSRTSSP